MTDGGNAPQISRGMPSRRVRSEHLKDVRNRGVSERDGDERWARVVSRSILNEIEDKR